MNGSVDWNGSTGDAMFLSPYDSGINNWVVFATYVIDIKKDSWHGETCYFSTQTLMHKWSWMYS